MLVRDFRILDAEALASLMVASVREGTTAFYDESQRDAWASGLPDASALTSRLAGMKTLVAEDGGGLLGFMTLDDTGYIDLAYVRPDRIGTGVASELYAAIENIAREDNHHRLHSHASEMARPFFERHGWSMLQRQTVAVRGVELTNYRMEKLLR